MTSFERHGSGTAMMHQRRVDVAVVVGGEDDRAATRRCAGDRPGGRGRRSPGWRAPCTIARIGPLVMTARAAFAGAVRAQSVSKLAPSLLGFGGTTMPLGTLGLRYGKPSALRRLAARPARAAPAASPTLAARAQLADRAETSGCGALHVYAPTTARRRPAAPARGGG